MAIPNQVGRISGPLLKDDLLRRGTDLAFETDLLYLDVNTHSNGVSVDGTGRIGIRTDAPTRDFHVDGDTRYQDDFDATNSFTVGNLTFDGPTNSLSAQVGAINLVSANSFRFTELRTDNLSFTNSGIRAYAGDDIKIYPGPGTGIFNIPTDLKSYGNIHATGDITFDGNIFIGGDSQDDTLSFVGDIESNLIPDQTLTYNLGQDDQRWGEVHVQSMTGLNDIVVDNTISLAGVRVNLGIENKWYVSTNGTDQLTGNHPNFAFGTIRHALQQLEESTNGPHEVHVLPGTYIEDFPLEVPANVTVKGAGIRSVIVKPKVPGRYQDAFLLNDASMVSDLTVKDFHYNANQDVGYGFRFAPNAGIVTKSPYVQNVTVITQGDTRTANDPRGFDSGDAGRGAVIDGAVLDTASPRASILFNAVTFITPGADGIILKNNARSEIIDSFTYFADTSIKLESGSEARIIASASVYGNKGITADGVGTICYAISHNFAYVGTGKDVENDDALVNQLTETEETNGGRVYFQSQDQNGDFRVGDNFIVDLGKGTTSIAINESDLGASALTVGVGGNTTFIDANKIEVPNFRISNNKIETLEDELNFSSDSGNINLNANVLMPNVDITGNVTIGGSAINFGNEAGDTVDFAMDFEQNLLPSLDTQSNIGSNTKRWKQLNSGRFTNNSIEIQNNVIQATDTNSELEFRGSGTGTVKLEDIKFKTTITSDQGDVAFSAGGDITIINTNSHLQLPTGTTQQDPAQGNAIRFDTDLNEFELYSTGKIALNGIKDGDRDTQIDLNSNKYTFYANNQYQGELDGSGNLIVNRFSSQDQFAIDGNTVTVGSALNPQAGFTANGAGKVVLDTANIAISGSTIENTVADADITFTGTGVKQNRTIQFDSVNGYVGPYGSQVDRDATIPRLGALWFNTNNNLLEVYAGEEEGWVSSIGVQAVTVTPEIANELNVVYNLILN